MASLKCMENLPRCPNFILIQQKFLEWEKRSDTQTAETVNIILFIQSLFLLTWYLQNFNIDIILVLVLRKSHLKQDLESIDAFL